MQLLPISVTIISIEVRNGTGFANTQSSAAPTPSQQNLTYTDNNAMERLWIIDAGIYLMKYKWTNDHEDNIALVAVINRQEYYGFDVLPLVSNPSQLNAYGLIYDAPFNGRVLVDTELDKEFEPKWNWPPNLAPDLLGIPTRD